MYSEESKSKDKEPLPEDRCLKCGAMLEAGERDLCSYCDECHGDACKITVPSPQIEIKTPMDRSTGTMRARIRTVSPFEVVSRE